MTIDEMLLGEGEVTPSADSHEGDAFKQEYTGESLHICFDDIYIKDEEDDISITRQGIHIKEKNGDDFTMGTGGIYLNGECVNNKKKFIGLSSSYPILMIVVFFILQVFVGWSNAWIVFLTIPVYTSLVSAILHKDARRFAYPALLATVYVFIGMQYGLWHPWWIMF